MSKIEAGKMDIVMEAFDFNAMLRSAETIIRVKTDEKKQKLTVKLDESLNRAVISDEHRLLQVLVNLLSNANKFTPEGGEIGVTMTVRPTENENRVKIGMEVRDNGIGLTQEQQERLFRAFEQADGSITRKYGGTGLGLAICKKILLALGGDIWVKSKPNQGACFMFELETELGGAVEAADGDARQPLDGKTGTPDWRGKTLLLAEDVDINREIVEIMLEDTGIKVVSAANGREALDLFTADPAGFDLILMDVQMPVMDGLSATKLLRELNTPNAKTVPIVAMTANAFKEDVDQCIASGMDGHIAKPIVIESFFEVLKAFLH